MMGMTMHIKSLTIGMMALTGAAISPCDFAVAAPPPTEADLAHPDLQPDALLKQLADEIQKSLIDPGSTQQIRLCRPHYAKIENGQVTSWALMFAANTKNEVGGYAGRRFYSAYLRKGRVEIRPGPSLVGNQTGFDMLIAKRLERDVGSCERIPADKVKALLNG
jgi:hypothetical protein